MNPNIALSFQRPTFDPAEGQRNALAMRQAQMQEAATLMQFQQAQQTATRDAAKRNALAKVDWNSPESLTQARGALGQAGDVDGVMAIDNYMKGLKSEERAARTAELDAVTKVAPLLSSPETYGQGLALAGQYAPEFAAKLPPQFDPKAAEGITRMAVGAKGWLDYQQNQQRADFDRQKFDYQKGQDAIQNRLKADEIDARRDGTRAAKISDEAGMRKEFTAGSKEFVTVRDAYKKVARSAANPSAAGDMAMIFSIMKMFDPNSVVRETEYATAQNAAGVPEQLQNTWNRLLSGERLAPAQRQDFINTARGLMQTQLEAHSQYRDEFSRIASESGIEPSRVVVDYTKGLTLDPPRETQGLPQPKIGLTRNGYQFQGGDPTDPTSWKKIK